MTRAHAPRLLQAIVRAAGAGAKGDKWAKAKLSMQEFKTAKQGGGEAADQGLVHAAAAGRPWRAQAWVACHAPASAAGGARERCAPLAVNLRWEMVTQ